MNEQISIEILPKRKIRRKNKILFNSGNRQYNQGIMSNIGLSKVWFYRLDHLLSRIANEHTEYIHFYFTPDQFIEQAEYAPMDKNDDKLFIKSNCNLNFNTAFAAPKLAHG